MRCVCSFYTEDPFFLTHVVLCLCDFEPLLASLRALAVLSGHCFETWRVYKVLVLAFKELTT